MKPMPKEMGYDSHPDNASHIEKVGGSREGVHVSSDSTKKNKVWGTKEVNINSDSIRAAEQSGRPREANRLKDKYALETARRDSAAATDKVNNMRKAKGGPASLEGGELTKATDKEIAADDLHKKAELARAKAKP